MFAILKNILALIPMDQQYYILKPSLDEKETGKVYPAVISYPDYDFDGPRSIYKIRSDQFPDFVPDLRFKLARGAKLCDMMTEAASSFTGLLISTNIFKILNDFYICPHRYYDVMIETKTGVEKYYFIHFVWNEGVNNIDYKNSEFVISEFGNITNSIKIISFEELLSKQNEIGRFKMISFTKTKYYSSPFDLFINPINLKIIITEKIKQKLIEEKISGLNIEMI